MKIGLISDTHGNYQRTIRAIDRLKAGDVSAVIHCGDFGSEAILISLVEAFKPLGVPVYAVYGNVDQHGDAIAYMPEREGLRMLGRSGKLLLSGHRIAVIHGDDTGALREAVSGGEYDYVFTGHTHQADDQRIGRTRVINPGAIHRATIPSCAVLDLDTGELVVLPIAHP